MSPSVAIIIVNWNSYGDTSQCLESLKSLDYPNSQTIVVDNGSEDGSGEKLKTEYPNVIFLKNLENLGFTGGNNTGIQYALENGSDYLMLLNNDTVITDSFLKPLVDLLEQHERIGAVQPKIMFNQDRSIIWNAGGKFNPFITKTTTIGENEVDQGQFDEPKETDWITGCCFLVRSRVINDIGLLDQRFFIYHEDVDWSLKIRNRGLKMFYEPKSVIFHETGMSDKNHGSHNEGNVSPFSHYMGVKNHLFLVRRYAKGINLIGSWSYQLIKLSGYLVYFALRGRYMKFKFVLKGISDGLTK